MRQGPHRLLRRVLLHWAAGAALLTFLWLAPLTRRLAAGLVRLAVVSIAPLLSTSTEHDAAMPTWMFALCVLVASAELGLLLFALGAVWRASIRRAR